MPAKKPTKAATPAVPEHQPETASISMKDGPKDDRLKACAKFGAEDLIAVLAEKEKQIIEDIERIIQESDEGEKALFKVGLSITLDLGKLVVDTNVTYSVKTSVKQSHRLNPDNPNEPQLPWED